MSEDKEGFETALRGVIADLKAPKGQYNSFGKYNYRNAEDILEAVKPLLDKAKLRLKTSDDVIQVGERYYVRSTVTVIGFGLVDSATGFARESETKKGMDESQITGASSSYAKKYALNDMFDIDDTKDADSQDNSGSKGSADKYATDKQKLEIKELLAKEGLTTDKMPTALESEYGIPVGSPMTYKQAEDVIKDLRTPNGA